MKFVRVSQNYYPILMFFMYNWLSQLIIPGKFTMKTHELVIQKIFCSLRHVSFFNQETDFYNICHYNFPWLGSDQLSVKILCVHGDFIHNSVTTL